MLKPGKKHWENLRKLATKEVTKSYNSYINNMGESLTTNPKQFWSFIRQNKTKNLGIPVLKVNNDLKTADHDKANARNDLFKSVFYKLTTSYPNKRPITISLNSNPRNWTKRHHKTACSSKLQKSARAIRHSCKNTKGNC